MEAIQIFKNESFGEVRVAGTSEQPLFCLADVCKVLDLQQGHVRERLDDGVVSTEPITDSMGRTQQANFVNEDGLYDVILDSRKPQAKAFRKWVTGEVLPSIRKHGAYMTERTLEQALLSPDYLIRLASRLKDERQRRMEAEEEGRHLALENGRLSEKIEKDAPNVLFAESYTTSDRCCLMAELAKMLKQNGIGQNRLFQWMRDNGYLCSKGLSYNQPTQMAMDLKLFEMKHRTINNPDGSVRVTTTTMVTAKGQVYFVNRFLEKYGRQGDIPA